MNRSVLAFVLALLLVGASFNPGLSPPAGAQPADPAIVITEGRGRAFNVAVQTFVDTSLPADAKRAAELRRSVEGALTFSGLVKPLASAAFLGPEVTGRMHDRNRADCADWVQGGADAVVEGAIRGGAGDEYVIEFAVWDVQRCLRLSRDAFDRSAGAIERVGKRIGDEVIAAFTGQRGSAATEIAFISTRSGEREVYVMDADGGNAREATKGRSVKAFPDWLPGGIGIMYTAYVSGIRAALFVTSRSPSVTPGPFLDRLFEESPIYRGVFDPTGEAVALVATVSENTDIFRVRRDGRGLQRLTTLPAIEVSPTWSPDGSQIAYVSDRSGLPQLYVMNRDGSGDRRLTYEGSYNTAPEWSPDGRWIAYESRLEGQFDIWVIDPTGEVNFPVVSHRASDETPSWSPDSRRIVFASNRRGRKDLYVADLAGSEPIRLTRNAGDNLAPSWGPYPR